MRDTVYIFIDEGGNTGFSGQNTSTKYFTLTAALTLTPVCEMAVLLERKRYDLIKYFDSQHINSGFEYFHANSDNKHVRKKVYEIIMNNSDTVKYFSIIANKEKVFRPLQNSQKFYYTILGFILKYVVKHIKYQISGCSEVVVICDTLPGFPRNSGMEDKLITIIKDNGLDGKVVHHKSSSHLFLQVVDYINYAVWQKWEHSKTENYDLIKALVIKELECF